MRSSWCPHGNQALWVREDMPLFLPVANFLLSSDPAQVGTQLCTHSSSAQTPVRTILPLRINECGPRKVGFGVYSTVAALLPRIPNEGPCACRWLTMVGFAVGKGEWGQGLGGRAELGPWCP